MAQVQEAQANHDKLQEEVELTLAEFRKEVDELGKSAIDQKKADDAIHAAQQVFDAKINVAKGCAVWPTMAAPGSPC